MNDIKKIQEFTKLLKKHLTKEWGKRCDVYNFECQVCRNWRLYDELERFSVNLKELDNYKKKHGI